MVLNPLKGGGSSLHQLILISKCHVSRDFWRNIFLLIKTWRKTITYFQKRLANDGVIHSFQNFVTRNTMSLKGLQFNYNVKFMFLNMFILFTGNNQEIMIIFKNNFYFLFSPENICHSNGKYAALRIS